MKKLLSAASLIVFCAQPVVAQGTHFGPADSGFVNNQSVGPFHTATVGFSVNHGQGWVISNGRTTYGAEGYTYMLEVVPVGDGGNWQQAVLHVQDDAQSTEGTWTGPVVSNWGQNNYQVNYYSTGGDSTLGIPPSWFVQWIINGQDYTGLSSVIVTPDYFFEVDGRGPWNTGPGFLGTLGGVLFNTGTDQFFSPWPWIYQNGGPDTFYTSYGINCCFTAWGQVTIDSIDISPWP